MRSIKSRRLIIIFLLVLTLTACSTNSKKLVSNFIPYRSTEICTKSPDFSACKEGIINSIPPFRIKYPPGWETGWFADRGITALLIASGDVNDAWQASDYDGGLVMILPGTSSGAEGDPLDEFIFKEGEVTSGPTRTKINGVDANMVVFIDQGLLSGQPAINIEYTVVHDRAILHIIGTAPLEKADEFRPYLEAIVSTLAFE